MFMEIFLLRNLYAANGRATHRQAVRGSHMYLNIHLEK